MNKTTRREWMRGLSFGSVMAAGTAIAGCSTSQKFVAPAKGAKMASPTSFPLQVICHGMMAFKLPRPTDDQSVLEIHIPKIDRSDGHPHVYEVGQQSALQSLNQGKTYALTGPTPAPGIPPAMWINNVILVADGTCTCSIQPYNNGGVIETPEWCVIKIPMPSSYKGYKIASHPNLANPIFADGDTRQSCDVNLTRMPLVHVFRYDVASSASLTGDSSVTWNLSSGPKLHIHAEPQIAMSSASNSHLQGLNKFFTRTNGSGQPVPLDLDFYNLNDITNIQNDADGAGGPIQDSDLRSLYQMGGLSTAGDPADCMSVVTW
jgi:hypothetical protein